MKCDYCGNTSGLLDERGNCVSCGAVMPIQNRNERHIPSPFAEPSFDFPYHIPRDIDRIAKWDGSSWNAIMEQLFIDSCVNGDAFIEIDGENITMAGGG